MSLRSVLQKAILLFLKPCIIFESYPDFSDNTKFVFDEFVRRGYDKKYYYYWYLSNEKAAEYNKGKFVSWNTKERSSFAKYIRHLRYYKKSKAKVFCNRYIVPNAFADQKNSFYLGHGIPLKNSSKYYKTPDEIEYCISPSEEMRRIISYGHNFDINKIYALGYPRNDAFKSNKIDVKRVLSCENAKKVIVWYPTFKQHESGVRTGSSHSIPLIYDEDKAKELNDYLESIDTVFVVKPHFSQDLAYVNKIELSHIRFIDDNFYKENGIVPYEFIASCDALLTDYSSVFFDYTLCDKPIGLIWEDIEEFLKNPGLHPDYEYLTKGTEKIYSLDDLKQFAADVVNGNDKYADERREMSRVFNISSDGKNSSRVVDFIVEKAGL